MVAVCGTFPYKGLIKLLLVEVYMYQVLVRLVYTEIFNVLNSKDIFLNQNALYLHIKMLF